MVVKNTGEKLLFQAKRLNRSRAAGLESAHDANLIAGH
jgi:hypothetical protein